MWNSGLKARGQRERRPTAAESEPTARSWELAAHIALLDLASDAIFARDVDRRITFWNRGAQNTYGFAPAEALGVTPRDLLRTEYPIPLEEKRRSCWSRTSRRCARSPAASWLEPATTWSWRRTVPKRSGRPTCTRARSTCCSATWSCRRCPDPSWPERCSSSDPRCECC
jgi:PAS domain-containing protein